LLPLVDGQVDQLRERLFFEQSFHAAYEPMRAVRTDRHILIHRFDKRASLVLPNTDDTPAKQDMMDHDWSKQPRHEEMLYDHYFDPDQKNNLIGCDELSQVETDLRSSLAHWMQETDDPILHGPIELPSGIMVTDPEAYSPGQEPLIVGK
jgi:N-sulfoglucosamine sulfohydrolase